MDNLDDVLENLNSRINQLTKEGGQVVNQPQTQSQLPILPILPIHISFSGLKMKVAQCLGLAIGILIVLTTFKPKFILVDDKINTKKVSVSVGLISVAMISVIMCYNFIKT